MVAWEGRVQGACATVTSNTVPSAASLSSTGLVGLTAPSKPKRSGRSVSIETRTRFHGATSRGSVCGSKIVGSAQTGSPGRIDPSSDPDSKMKRRSGPSAARSASSGIWRSTHPRSAGRAAGSRVLSRSVPTRPSAPCAVMRNHDGVARSRVSGATSPIASSSVAPGPTRCVPVSMWFTGSARATTRPGTSSSGAKPSRRSATGGPAVPGQWITCWWACSGPPAYARMSRPRRTSGHGMDSSIAPRSVARSVCRSPGCR